MFKPFTRTVRFFTIGLTFGLLGALVAPTTSALARVERPKLAVVQLESMLVPSLMRRNRDGFAVVTALVEIKKGVPVHEICMYSVKVKEVIFLTLHSNPMRAIRDDEVVLSPDLRRTIIQRLNSVVGGEKVANVIVVDGQMSMGSGVSAKLPYATVAGCKEFKKMEEEKVKAATGDNADAGPDAPESGH